MFLFFVKETLQHELVRFKGCLPFICFQILPKSFVSFNLVEREKWLFKYQCWEVKKYFLIRWNSLAFIRLLTSNVTAQWCGWSVVIKTCSRQQNMHSILECREFFCKSEYFTLMKIMNFVYDYYPSKVCDNLQIFIKIDVFRKFRKYNSHFQKSMIWFIVCISYEERNSEILEKNMHQFWDGKHVYFFL